MTETSVPDLEAKMAALKQQHGELEKKLNDMRKDPLIDDLEIQAIKKRKLLIKDSIYRIELQLRA